ncbi:MAG: guanylate kinase [Chlamydiota bacterium]
MSNKLLGNLSQGLLFIVSAPAGTGKTTLAHMLCDEFEAITLSVSCTTRSPRAHEIPGKDYHFISSEEFEERLHHNAFLEYVSIFDHSYGTLYETIAKEQHLGRHVLLVIDTQGQKQIKSLGVPHISIFIHPPSWAELRHRLEKRGTENCAAIDKRLAFAEYETSSAPLYDYEVVNDHLQTAYQILRAIIIAEEHKRLKTLPKEIL